MFDSLLVANRGEIARRVIRTAKRMGLRTIAVYSEADAALPFVAEADEAVLIGPAAVAESYHNAYAILKAARASGAQAIHPGYGFLSENSEFAEAVEGAGLVWVGPSADAIIAMGNKVAARNLVAAAGCRWRRAPKHPVTTAEAAAEAAEQIGFPVMIKAAAGGGGMGMAVVDRPEDLAAEFEKVTNFAGRLFGDPSVFLERYFPRVRHVEVQILGLPDGTRAGAGRAGLLRPAPEPEGRRGNPVAGALDDALRERMLAAAAQGRRGRALPGRRHGRVPARPASRPMTADRQPAEFFFLEMNTRLQVEHPITEAVLGIDLVEAQLRVAAGEDPGFDASTLTRDGPCHRAADQRRGPEAVPPVAGAITRWRDPSGARYPGRRGLRAGHHGHPALRLADGQADRARRRPAGGAAARPAAAVARLHHRRTEVQPAVPRRAAGVPGVRFRRLRHRHCGTDARLMTQGRSGPVRPGAGVCRAGHRWVGSHSDRSSQNELSIERRADPAGRPEIHIPTK